MERHTLKIEGMIVLVDGKLYKAIPKKTSGCEECCFQQLLCEDLCIPLDNSSDQSFVFLPIEDEEEEGVEGDIYEYKEISVVPVYLKEKDEDSCIKCIFYTAEYSEGCGTEGLSLHRGSCKKVAKAEGYKDIYWRKVE